jgi:dimeric dUTPase (all-alpha-NTP-PPase superfamily)
MATISLIRSLLRLLTKRGSTNLLQILVTLWWKFLLIFLGIESFLKKHVDNAALELIASYVKIGFQKGTDLDDKTVKKEVVIEMVDAINYSGIEALFYLFDVPFLKV